MSQRGGLGTTGKLCHMSHSPAFYANAEATGGANVRSKPHGKHQVSPKSSEAELEPSSDEKVLPTSITFEASSQEQEDADISYDDSEGLGKEDAVQGEAEQEEEQEEEEEEEEEDRSEQGEEAETEGGSEEDAGSSAESEIPTDMDYAGDSDGLGPQDPTEAGVETATDDNADLLPTDESQAAGKSRGATITSRRRGRGAARPGGPEEEAGAESEGWGEMADASREEGEKGGGGEGGEAQQAKDSVESGGVHSTGGGAAGAGEEESNRNESSSHAKGKARKQKKNQRAKKAPEPREEASAEESQEPAQKSHAEKEPDTADNTVQKSKKRKTGKWATLVGMNPIQIRATEELFPRDRPSQDEAEQEAPVNPCEGFWCKRGKMCKANEENEPECVCQDPSSCTPSVTEFEHVCGTDNETYDTSCELFATKCNLEGTKRGHRLHLDYTGSCKFIAPCLEGELLQFPLRMRDWLKNVLLQLYEHDTRSPGFLTAKQRVKVQKIHESERRLHAGDHHIEMLVRDFEKNYNMYIYPVHWQFAQMDQHPTDRFLSHSELAPLRMPLVPMEHCTSRFFQVCDADKDKQVSFREWGHCFGIKDEDMDLNLLF
ncbi:hypothetical protein AAFF_G00273300 [Aldrovandia affinis]|uniref:Kazal-like domain-containing protein n=1 Tax=Aldrovandia affinis TaxID=143900 RepID=A0AAD7WSK3_9TELE|nr:hypothetical protein AAFF_G00273300 [Aldrovandia affinis]